MRIPVLGVKLTVDQHASGIWHYAQPCGHRIHPSPRTTSQVVGVKYNGGPLWKDGYTWQNVYWGQYFGTTAGSSWVKSVDRATADIETDRDYSGGLRQYSVGIGRLINAIMIGQDPPKQVSDQQIQTALVDWIAKGMVANLGQAGAYNIFLPPGTTASLSSDNSCAQFCDFHNTVNGPNGPFYTVEPYPCSQGCNQCSNSPLDTLTQGLSEEVIELKTDMDPGTGWVIGNLELCDFCDANFVCNRISTGEYVNSWYDKTKAACWIGK